MTIYEKIKTLSLEAMAEFFTEWPFDCNECSEGQLLSDNPLMKNERCSQRCVDRCVEWLKSEVKSFGEPRD